MRPILSDTLSILLPTEQDTLLLRACLGFEDTGREAWTAWLERVGEPREKLLQRRPSLVHFLPLLHVATKRYGAQVPRDLAFCLRAAHFREELRSQAYRTTLRRVLHDLRDGGIDFTVLKGAALAGTVYDGWALRHCHDIDLLVRETDQAAACRALQDAGMRQQYERYRMSRGVRFLHDSELPIELHTDLFEHPLYQHGAVDMLGRRQTTDIDGIPVHVLSPSAAFLHVCGHASYSGNRSSLRWATDAWSIAVKRADLDWDAFLWDTARAQLALPLYVMLEYLAVELGAPIPRSVLQSLAHDARHVGAAAREAALFGVRGSYEGLRNVTRDWRSCAFLLRWRLLPSPSYLRWTYGTRSRGEILLLYFERVARYIAQRARLAQRMKRPPSETSE